jgi:hypothetical protein
MEVASHRRHRAQEAKYRDGARKDEKQKGEGERERERERESAKVR